MWSFWTFPRCFEERVWDGRREYKERREVVILGGWCRETENIGRERMASISLGWARFLHVLSKLRRFLSDELSMPCGNDLVLVKEVRILSAFW